MPYIYDIYVHTEGYEKQLKPIYTYIYIKEKKEKSIKLITLYNLV